VQVVDAAAFGRFARLHLRHRAPRLSNAEEIEQAVAAAQAAEIAVVVVGTNPETESEGWDRSGLSLPGDQNELVRRVSAANPRTVVVVNAGAPVLLPWLEDVAAVLWWWLPGQEAGNALADVLTGDTEPSGRLPWTLPRREEDVPVPNGLPSAGIIDYAEGLDVGHRGWDRLALAPARPFGYGLGYTNWRYDSISASEHTADGIAVEVSVTNTGVRVGREVVQVYAASDGSDAVRPIRWLAGFAVIDAAPGESVTARIQISQRSFESWDTSTSAWILPPGQYTLSAGRSSRDLLTDVVVGIGSEVDYEASRL
jgi:beta-glucosidase